MDSENEYKMPDANVLKALPRVKKPRKPRPGEIATKEAKAKKRTRKTDKRQDPDARKVRRLPKAKKPAKRPKVVKTKRKPGKAKAKAPVIERCERLDLRLTKAEKFKITTRAKKLRRTLTSVISEAISRLP